MPYNSVQPRLNYDVMRHVALFLRGDSAEDWVLKDQSMDPKERAKIKNAQRDLRNMSLVCQAFRYPAQRVLLQSIVLPDELAVVELTRTLLAEPTFRSNVHQLRVDVRVGRNLFDPGSRNIHSAFTDQMDDAENFIAGLNTSPDWKREWSYVLSLGWCTAFWSLLIALTTNVKTLHIHQLDRNALRAPIPRDLNWNLFRYTFNGNALCLGLFEGLRHVKYLKLTTGFLSQVMMELPNLRTLDLAFAELWLVGKKCDFFIRKRGPVVETIRSSLPLLSPFIDAEAKLPHFPGITALHLDMDCRAISQASPECLELFLEIFPGLEHLRLYHSQNAERCTTYSPPEVVSLLKASPRSIKTVDLSAFRARRPDDSPILQVTPETYAIVFNRLAIEGRGFLHIYDTGENFPLSQFVRCTAKDIEENPSIKEQTFTKALDIVDWNFCENAGRHLRSLKVHYWGPLAQPGDVMANNVMAELAQVTIQCE